MDRRRRNLAAIVLGMALAVVLASCNLRITDGNATSRGPDISADGRYVAFSSYASDLVPGDTNGYEDVFVWDRQTRATVQVTEGDADSYDATISADGRYVAFTSGASDLVPNDPSAWDDIFVWDRVTGTTTAITEGNSPANPSISGDGRYVAYESWDSQLAPDDTPGIIDVFVWDRQTGSTTRITDDDLMDSVEPSVSLDGRYVAYQTALHYKWEDPPIPFADVFVHDLVTGTTTQVTDGNNDSSEPDISADGQYVAFYSQATDLVPGDPNGSTDDVYVWEAATGTIIRLGPSRNVAISDDGRYVAYGDVLVWDRTTGTTVDTTNTAGPGWCASIELSGDGQYLTYHCSHPDLDPGDTNGVIDVFVWDRHHWQSPGS